MQLSLVVLRGTNAGQIIPIQRAEFCIGRDETCELWAQKMTISRRHTAILMREDRVVIRDLGSSNGTFVNGVVVVGEVEVEHNDRLRIGPLEFRIQVRLDRERASVAAPIVDEAEEATAKHLPPASSQTSPSKPANNPFPRGQLDKAGLLLKQYNRGLRS
jgi:pSer/pThr/pTyr-binding forkhead associated (FHA) protein